MLAIMELCCISYRATGARSYFPQSHNWMAYRFPVRPLLAAAAFLPLCASVELQAKTPEVLIVSESDLQFGKFMVFGTGSRTVSASGVVRDLSIVPLEGARTAPARFTVSYDRGNESKHVLDIELEIVLSAPPAVTIDGVSGRVSELETDLAGTGRVSPGQPIRVWMRNCRTRVCSQSFQVGGKISVDRRYGGAVLSVPIPIDATVLMAERQR